MKTVITAAWSLLASTRTTGVIAMLMAGLALTAALVPQGSDALELARYENSEAIQTLAAWGLTNILDSAWLKALCVLLVGNAIAVTADVYFSAARVLDMPDRAPEDTALEAARPEVAVETLRETFRTSLGASPAVERVDGARVTMAFDAGSFAHLAPMWSSFGLVLLVIGAVWASRPPPRQQQTVRAVLEVTDSQTRTSGIFDMVEDEPFQFFQWRARYIVRDYAGSRAGLGPAIRIERVFSEQKRRDDFWVYLDAPPGFDARHRKGFVSIAARSLRLFPRPGAGLASSGAAIVLLAGLGLLVFGAIAGTQAQGRIWIDVDGRNVRLAGAPRLAGDPLFKQAFHRWDLMARAVLAE